MGITINRFDFSVLQEKNWRAPYTLIFQIQILEWSFCFGMQISPFTALGPCMDTRKGCTEQKPEPLSSVYELPATH